MTCGLSFAQGGEVRAEVYIDTEDGEENKAVFDALEKDKRVIEGQFGEPLRWERLDHRRASRIAVYRTGTIEDSEQLGEIKTWAVERLLKLKKVFGSRIAELAREA